MRLRGVGKRGNRLMGYKLVVRKVRRPHGNTATLMPKPVFEDNGSGMHTHFSLWKGSQPLFAGEKYAGMSDMALNAIGGGVTNARAVFAFACPTTNPHKASGPGFRAPANTARRPPHPP